VVLELIGWLFIASATIISAAALLNMAGFPRKLNELSVLCYPLDPRIPVPETATGRVVFKAPRDILLAQASEDEGWSQQISLQHRIKIPKGYTGLLSLMPMSFRMSNGRTHVDVMSPPEFLPSGWEGDLLMLLINRHSSEPAICDRESPLACLYLLPADVSIGLRDTIA